MKPGKCGAGQKLGPVLVPLKNVPLSLSALLAYCPHSLSQVWEERN